MVNSTPSTKLWGPALGLACGGIFIFGFTVGLRAAFWKDILTSLYFSDSQGGLILLAETIGFLSFNVIGSYLLRQFGYRVTTVFSVIIQFWAILLYSQGGELWVMMGASFILGSANSLIHLCGNTFATHSGQGMVGKKALNYAHIFFGVGALLAPAYAQLGGHFHYLWGSLLQIVPVNSLFWVIAIWVWYNPKNSNSQNNDLSLAGEEKGRIEPISHLTIQHLIKDPIFLIGFFALLFYVTMDSALLGWYVNYLTDVKSFTVASAQQSFTLFFIFLTLGRLLAAIFSDQIRPLHLFWGAVMAFLCLLTGILLPNQGGWVLSLTGLMLSFLFPMITSVVTNHFPENSVKVMGYLFIAPGIGSIVGPYTLGGINDWIGKEFGFYLCLGCMLGVVIFIYLLSQKIVNKKP